MPELLSSIADLAWPAVTLLGLVLFARPLAGLLRSGLPRAGHREYGAIITDMGRWEGGRHCALAGIDLTRELRAAGNATPVLVFTSDRSIREHGQEARAAGAETVTSSGVDLLAFLRRRGVAS